MGPPVRAWVGDIVAKYQPQSPVLEVGAYDVNGTIRDLFPQDGYVGLDIREGPGVDMVADIINPPKILLERFNTVVCCETLEHISKFWVAMEKMYDALLPGGLFIGTWVFVCHIHEHPEDYWRCTPAGFRFLLEDVGFVDVQIDTQGDGPVGVFAVARKAQRN